MKISKRIVAILQALVIMVLIVLSYNKIQVNAKVFSFRQKPIKIAVFLYNSNDTYISLVGEGFKEIQKENQDKVEFIFYDGKNDQSTQNDSIDKVLENENVDLIFLNLVDTKVTGKIINKIKAKNIPVILFNREPADIDSIKSYNKAFFVGTDAREAGIIQGKILANEWKSNKNIDRNKDGIMQYVMLMGERDNTEAIDRTRYSVSTINSQGIQTQEIALKICDWNRDTARNVMDSLFSINGNRIEVIISNNDEMAIGAIEVLQKYGYNKGDKEMYIPVVGVDAIPEARKLVDEGIMTGTVIQNPNTMAKVVYDMGMNLVYERKPLDGIQYDFDQTGVAVRLPYGEYTG
ncbi:D-galactose-binding periplasmic protein precursor [Clostridium saccharobutylicum]|uniref:galactose ABC transporter substrate-binding protein n=1 Tax=Clostridium saccharobutylicum TaxID=169679 RepID=UPI0009839272|nr:galactose ABC transporter substrate-binding protein [Clostridium saccharobutylicum]AQS11242.1 D-galactose-binding periplasmic protein precursor [Clostridium saccharobutylicum]MBC2438137.1 galactose ABC transporter substrate-binding protein [Clostridium saccharobutylicum]NSB90601.1 methyl-galactoside transport system substrate-binding protein [Clostridium saccharobutylicum]NYC30797.1 methyl-galactoside transport system substrate-binding protein [Clostridium saccharobutylicum]OOM18100.1 D-gal